jgi:hypothetical protein
MRAGAWLFRFRRAFRFSSGFGLMAHKQVIFGSAAREKILRGAAQLSDAIRITLGGLPRNKWRAFLIV